MPAEKMHADEVDTDVSLVRRLLAAQFPHWADLPIAPVESAGTDNAIYRLDDDMAVRLPRIHWATGQPVPLGRGEPAEGYPWSWSVYR
jgi:aminoglycoside phosphotransferase (APT) family kinase protein